MSLTFEFEVVEKNSADVLIKVVGVGGGGCNAIDNMIESSLKGVDFICANTDAQSLKRNKAVERLQLGTNLTNGLGAGANPEVGRNAALEDRERIAEVLRGAKMVFITAGMGGGTGTGAAPVVAEVAKELGVLTVGVVTRPFTHEGKRQKIAQAGIDELKKHVDSLIVIPNDKLMEVLGDDVTMRDAFRAADNVLKDAVAGISEVITCPGLINVDFADVQTVMKEMGMAMMSSSQASGIDRARVAAEQAVASPLLDNISLEGARGVLVNISTAPGCLKMSEYSEIMSIVRQYADDNAEVKFGAAEVEGMDEDEIRVTLIATGLGATRKSARDERPEYIKIVKTGTDDRPTEVIDYDDLDVPAVMRQGRRAALSTDFSNPQVSESYDIPAFLRKQAD